MVFEIRMKTHSILIMTGILVLSMVAATAADYRVKRGDSLAGIAKMNGTTVTELRADNRLKGDLIHPGQVLKLPAKPTSSRTHAGDGTHVVKSGETLWSISRQYGVGVAELKKINSLNRPENLRVGSRLLLHRVPASVSSTAPGKSAVSTKTDSVDPATAPQVLPPRPPASTDQSNSESFRSIILKLDESVGALALRHGMTPEQLNSVNGWDYDADTLLAAGSEVHVPSSVKH
jgi:LysM repeat protein